MESDAFVVSADDEDEDGTVGQRGGGTAVASASPFASRPPVTRILPSGNVTAAAA